MARPLVANICNKPYLRNVKENKMLNNNPAWQKSNQIGGKREEKKKNTVNSGHCILPATPKGTAHNSFGPINTEASMENY